MTDPAPDPVKYGYSDDVDISFEDFIGPCPYCGGENVNVRNFSDGYNIELRFDCDDCEIIRYDYE